MDIARDKESKLQFMPTFHEVACAEQEYRKYYKDTIWDSVYFFENGLKKAKFYWYDADQVPYNLIVTI